ncbi:hypothetical protein J4435_05670 [Candidatus Woesearchaeota archaeon]|nr:hypothetical protein [Candidatus Woesearchaeota archaeon]
MNVFRAMKRYFSRRDGEFRAACAGVNEELEEHLQAINENTSEIAQNHEYLCALEAKMDKLAERLDHMQLFMGQFGYGDAQRQFTVRPLSTEEKRVFVAIYASEDAKGHVTYADISKALLMDIQLVSGYVASLIEKGVPVVKRYVNDIAYLRLDQHFKQLQAKENLLCIDKAQKQLVQF